MMGDPAVELAGIVDRLRRTNDLNIRSELLAQKAVVCTGIQTLEYAIPTQRECAVYASSRRRGEKLPSDCEKHDCNGYRNPCPLTYDL